MQQLACVEPHRLEWRDVPAPRIQSEHEALVRPLAVARCDIDLFLVSGFFPAKQPFALGHECVAEVVELGSAVRGLSPGDRVVVAFQVSCGTCRSCRAGHSANCDSYPLLSDYGMQPLSGVEYGGMLADLVRVPFANAMLRKVAPGLDPVALASVSDNVLDGYRAVAPHLASLPGSEVLIVSHGYPSIPLYAAQAALALGASRVVFASHDQEQLAYAQRLGAVPLHTDFKQREPHRFPIVVDAGLFADGLRYAIDATEHEGICQSVSFFPERDVALPVGKMYTRGIRFFTGRTHASALLPAVLPLIESGRLHPEAVTTRVVSRDQAERAYLEPATKLVVTMT
jgi:alcohol dehydrogenase